MLSDKSTAPRQRAQDRTRNEQTQRGDDHRTARLEAAARTLARYHARRAESQHLAGSERRHEREQVSSRIRDRARRCP